MRPEVWHCRKCLWTTGYVVDEMTCVPVHVGGVCVWSVGLIVRCAKGECGAILRAINAVLLQGQGCLHSAPVGPLCFVLMKTFLGTHITCYYLTYTVIQTQSDS